MTMPGVQSGERVSMFSLRAVRPAVYAGKVTSIGSNTVTDAGANWTAAQFAGRGALYAEFASGLEADIQQVSYVAKTLSFSGPVPPSLQVGVAFRIREHHTIAEVFGAANQVGLRPGANAAEAEQVLQYLPESQSTRTYFYYNFDTVAGWVRAPDYAPGSNVVIYPEQGLMLRRKAATDLTLTWSGPLKQGPSIIPVYPGYNLVGVYNRATPVALAGLNLITGNPATGFTPGENPATSDNLLIMNPDGISSRTYFYLNLTGFEGWHDSVTYQPADQVRVAPGTAFWLNRRPPAQFFDWTLPAQ